MKAKVKIEFTIEQAAAAPLVEVVAAEIRTVINKWGPNTTGGGESIVGPEGTVIGRWYVELDDDEWFESQRAAHQPLMEQAMEIVEHGRKLTFTERRYIAHQKRQRQEARSGA